MTLWRRITQVKARPVAAYVASHQAPTVFVYWAGYALSLQQSLVYFENLATPHSSILSMSWHPSQWGTFRNKFQNFMDRTIQELAHNHLQYALEKLLE